MSSNPVPVNKTAPAPAPAPAADPWNALRTEMDHLFDRFSGAFDMPSWRRMLHFAPLPRRDASFGFAAPSVDVAEDDKSFRITAELPGIEPKDIEVSLAGDVLVLKGEKKVETEQKNNNYYTSERSYGSFERSFALPDGIDRDKIAAELAKGVLTVTLPKTAAAQKPAQKIDVKAAA